MPERKCLVLMQHRNESEYNDFLGKYYHFPHKYYNLISGKDIAFVYYEPKKRGAGEYFGYGKLGKVFQDKKQPEHYFAEIIEYKPFAKGVPFEDEAGVVRETEPTYNAQNAARVISPEVLDGICLDGGIQLNFKADAHLIKVLGEQLIASEKVGVLELIKNAYDANASYCKVRIENIPGMLPADPATNLFSEFAGPVIVIEDDGKGMDMETLENGWLRPASTMKTSVKEELKKGRAEAIASGREGTYEALVEQLTKAHGGRIPLGEKGVGRFATNRLGNNLILKTKRKDQEYEYVLHIDWSKFDVITNSGIDLDSVGVNLFRQKPSREYGERDSGTQLIVYGGKDGFNWSPDAVKDLNVAILSLNAPLPPDLSIRKSQQSRAGAFVATLECPQVPDLPAEAFVDVPPVFDFEGIIDSEGKLDYILKFLPPPSVPMPANTAAIKQYDLRNSALDYWKKGGKYKDNKAGAFYLRLKAWYRVTPWIDGPERKEFSDYLSNFGGISIFRDGLNIFPAQKASHLDWLSLSDRHIKQGYRISYYNFIGNLEISQTENTELIDKTDREGLVDNEAYSDLVRFVKAVIMNIVEPEFIGRRDAYSSLTSGLEKDPQKLKKIVKQGSDLTSNILKGYPFEDDPYQLLTHLGAPDERKNRLLNLEQSLDTLQKSLEQMNEVKEMLSEQAGYGLAIAVSVHEIAKIASSFYMGLSALLRSGRFDEDKLRELLESSKSIKSEIRRLGPLKAIRNEKPVVFQISKALRFEREVFFEKMAKLGIDVEIDSTNDFTLCARYGAICQVISNLFNNSCYWLDTKPKDQRSIKIVIDSKYRTVTIADSGPGVSDEVDKYLFQPGYSMRVPPSGLGLYICKYYMQGIKGDIYQTVPKERLEAMPGAQFTLDFHRVSVGDKA